MDAALGLLDEAKRLHIKTLTPDTRPVDALKARVHLKQGQLSKARDWVLAFLITAGAIFMSLTLILMPLGFNLGGYAASWGIYPRPWSELLAVADGGLRVFDPFCFLLLLHLFPDGHFAPRWLRWAAGLARLNREKAARL